MCSQNDHFIAESSNSLPFYGMIIFTIAPIINVTTTNGGVVTGVIHVVYYGARLIFTVQIVCFNTSGPNDSLRYFLLLLALCSTVRHDQFLHLLH